MKNVCTIISFYELQTTEFSYSLKNVCLLKEELNDILRHLKNVACATLLHLIYFHLKKARIRH